MREINISGGNPIRLRLTIVPMQHSVSRNWGCTPLTSVACFHQSLLGCSWLTCITGLGDLFWPFHSTDSSENHMHLQSAAPKEAFPVLLCHPAYINSVKGMQELSGKWRKEGSCSVREWQRNSRRTVLCNGWTVKSVASSMSVLLHRT